MTTVYRRNQDGTLTQIEVEKHEGEYIAGMSVLYETCESTVVVGWDPKKEFTDVRVYRTDGGIEVLIPFEDGAKIGKDDGK